jgi:arsenate reductase-like glutaredoxin family protein
MTAILYWKSTCTTAREVRSILRSRHPALGDRNYAREPLTEEEVLRLVRAAGGVAPLLNTRHEVAKTNGWKTVCPEPKTFAEAVVADCNLLRRPVLLVDGQALVGNQPQAMLQALARGV